MVRPWRRQQPGDRGCLSGCIQCLNWTSVPLLSKFFFQLVFAGTAATIVSGCMAERIHYKSFLLFPLILAGIFYPITGH